MPTAMTVADVTTCALPGFFTFDATRDGALAAIVASATGTAFADVEFFWFFGDNDSELWSTTGLTTNRATGVAAGHVYRSVGTYTVTLYVADFRPATPTVTAYTQQVTVTAMSGSTIHVATGGNDANDGSIGSPILTWAEAMTRLFASSGPRTVLLNRGDTFTVSVATSPSGVTGPFRIGAYGTGAKPVLTNTTSGNAPIRPRETALELVIADMRIECGLAANCHGFCPGIRVMMIDCEINQGHWGVFGDDPRYDDASIVHVGAYTGNFVVETTITNSQRYGCYWDHGAYNFILGCTFDNVTEEHYIRAYFTHSAISHCVFNDGIVAGKHSLKLPGYFLEGDPQFRGTEVTAEAEYTTVSDNRINNCASNWNCNIGPVDGAKDQRMRYFLLERNIILATQTGSQVGIMLNNFGHAVRNNIVVGTGASGTVSAIRVTRLGVEPGADQIVCDNNVGFRETSGAIRTVQITANVSGDVLVVKAQNNVAQSPTSPDAVSPGGAGIGGATITEAGSVQNANCGFVSAPTDFHLADGSICIGTGVVVASVGEDFARSVRNRTTFDAGAYAKTPDPEWAPDPEPEADALSISTPILVGSDFLGE